MITNNYYVTLGTEIKYDNSIEKIDKNNTSSNKLSHCNCKNTEQPFLIAL
jgi:hypothetical protein